VVEGPAIFNIALPLPVITPYFNAWGKNIYEQQGAFDHYPDVVPASSTSGSAVVVGREGFVGLLGRGSSRFRHDGHQTLTVEISEGGQAWVAEDFAGDLAWRAFNTFLGLAESPRHDCPNFWLAPEYNTWVEQKAAADPHPDVALHDDFVDRLLDRIDALDLPRGKFVLDDGWQHHDWSHMGDPQIVLARWGGLRIPSEALALTWREVDFAQSRFIVRATKTAHHQDGGVRVVPMFPELASHFQAAFDAAEEGDEFVITRFRHTTVNLRTQLLRYITAAGWKPWPKLWQNMRATRATELADRFPSHVCAKWLGHTEAVADEFYRQVTDEHFTKAVTPSEKAPPIPTPQPRARSCNGAQPARADGANTPCFPVVAEARENLQEVGMGAGGFEPPKA